MLKFLIIFIYVCWGCFFCLSSGCTAVTMQVLGAYIQKWVTHGESWPTMIILSWCTISTQLCMIELTIENVWRSSWIYKIWVRLLRVWILCVATPVMLRWHKCYVSDYEWQRIECSCIGYSVPPAECESNHLLSTGWAIERHVILSNTNIFFGAYSCSRCLQLSYTSAVCSISYPCEALFCILQCQVAHLWYWQLAPYDVEILREKHYHEPIVVLFSVKPVESPLR